MPKPYPPFPALPQGIAAALIPPTPAPTQAPGYIGPMEMATALFREEAKKVDVLVVGENGDTFITTKDGITTKNTNQSEDHNKDDIEIFLTDQFAHLKAQGYKTLYVERHANVPVNLQPDFQNNKFEIPKQYFGKYAADDLIDHVITLAKGKAKGRAIVQNEKYDNEKNDAAFTMLDKLLPNTNRFKEIPPSGTPLTDADYTVGGFAKLLNARNLLVDTGLISPLQASLLELFAANKVFANGTNPASVAYVEAALKNGFRIVPIDYSRDITERMYDKTNRSFWEWRLQESNTVMAKNIATDRKENDAGKGIVATGGYHTTPREGVSHNLSEWLPPTVDQKVFASGLENALNTIGIPSTSIDVQECVDESAGLYHHENSNLLGRTIHVRKQQIASNSNSIKK